MVDTNIDQQMEEVLNTGYNEVTLGDLLQARETVDTVSSDDDTILDTNIRKFGLDPNVERKTTFFPDVSREESYEDINEVDVTAPQALYDAVETMALSDAVDRGYEPTQEEILNAAMNMTGSSLVTSAIKGPTKKASEEVLGMGVVPKKDIAKAQIKDLKEKFGFTQDNPATYSGVQGEEWLVEKMRMAADTDDPTRLRGSVTATLGKQKGKDMYLPVDMLKNLKGARDEIREPGEYQYERLLKDVKKEGFDPTQKGFKINIGVNAGGKPYIIEGNTRVRVASDLNVPYVRVEVNYFNGGEMRGAEGYENLKHLEYFYPTKSTSFSPDNVISVAKTSDEIINTVPKKDIIKPQGRGLDIQFADYVKQALKAQGKIELPDGIIISEAPFKYSNDIIKTVAKSYQNKINIGFDATQKGGLDTIKGLTPARKAELGKKVPEGKLVAVRPNLNSDINDEAVPIPKIGKPDEPKKQPLLSVQEGGKVKGTVYADQPYVLVNPTKDKGVVSFTVDQELRAKVAGGENKDRLMAVRGEYTEYDVSKFSINNRNVVEIKFNPALQHLAIRADTNEALVGSKGKVLVIADRIYALKDDLIYARKRDAPKALGGHATNVVYRLNKGGLLDDQMKEILNVTGDDPLTDAQTDALGVFRGEPERDSRLIAQETDMLLDIAGGKENPEYGPMYGGPDKKLDSQDALALFTPPLPGIDPIFGETKKAFEEGRYGTGAAYAALTLLGLIPGSDVVTKPAAKKLSREVTERVEPNFGPPMKKATQEEVDAAADAAFKIDEINQSIRNLNVVRDRTFKQIQEMRGGDFSSVASSATGYASPVERRELLERNKKLHDIYTDQKAQLEANRTEYRKALNKVGIDKELIEKRNNEAMYSRKVLGEKIEPTLDGPSDSTIPQLSTNGKIEPTVGNTKPKTEDFEPIGSPVSTKKESSPEKTSFTDDLNTFNLKPMISPKDKPRLEASNYHYSSNIGKYINNLYENNPNGTIDITDLKRDFGLGKRTNPDAFPKDQTEYLGIKNLIEETKGSKISIAELKNRFDNNSVMFEERLYTPNVKDATENPLYAGDAVHLGSGFDLHSSDGMGNYLNVAPFSSVDRFPFHKENTRQFLVPIGQADPKKYKELVISVKGKTKARKASKEEIRQGFYIDEKGFRRPFTSEAQEGMDIPMRVDKGYVNIPHFADVENPISHSRFTTGVDIDGEKAFVVGEIQNDPFRNNVPITKTEKGGMNTDLKNSNDILLAGNQDNFEDRVTDIMRAGESSNIKNAIPVPSDTNFYLNKKLDNAIENRLKAEGRLRPDGKIEPTVGEYRPPPPTRDVTDPGDYGESKGIVENPISREERPVLPLSENIKDYPKTSRSSNKKPIPQKQWSEVTVKRLLIEAIEDGSDVFAWSTGDTQLAMNGEGFPKSAIEFYDEGIKNILLKIGKEHNLTEKDFLGVKDIVTGKFRVADDAPLKEIFDMARTAALYKPKKINDTKTKRKWVDLIGEINSVEFNEAYEDLLNGKTLDPDPSLAKDLYRRMLESSKEILNLYGENHGYTLKSEVFVMRIPEELKKAYSGLKEGTIEFNKGGTIDKEMGQLFAN